MIFGGMLFALPLATAGWGYGSFGYGWYGPTYQYQVVSYPGNGGYTTYGGYMSNQGAAFGGCSGSMDFRVCGGYSGGFGWNNYGSYGGYGNGEVLSFNFWGG